MRVIFMGSPEFAVPSLRTLAAGYEVVAVVTQPDRGRGRGRKTMPPPVKEAALELGIEVLQPARVGSAESLAALELLKPGLIVVAAYGQILPQALLDLPRAGALNVHASLLPRWRGASPVQAAIYHQDEQTGVTIMQMDAGLDTGPILAQKSTPLQASETGGELSARLSKMGGELLLETLPAYLEGALIPEQQDDSLATYAPMLRKSDGKLDLKRSASQLAAQVRAYEPWPGSFLEWEGQRLRVVAAHSRSDAQPQPGSVDIVEGKPMLGTASGALVLDQVQPPSRNVMPGEAFLQGYRDFLDLQLLA